jgi:hypothetical protein
MTVQLFADNTKVPSWTNRITLGLLGFLSLWLLMAFVPQRNAQYPKS